MTHTPTNNTIPTRKATVLIALKRGFINAFYDAYPISAWLLLSVVAGAMAAWIAGVW